MCDDDEMPPLEELTPYTENNNISAHVESPFPFESDLPPQEDEDSVSEPEPTLSANNEAAFPFQAECECERDSPPVAPAERVLDLTVNKEKTSIGVQYECEGVTAHVVDGVIHIGDYVLSLTEFLGIQSMSSTKYDSYVKLTTPHQQIIEVEATIPILLTLISFIKRDVNWNGKEAEEEDATDNEDMKDMVLIDDEVETTPGGILSFIGRLLRLIKY